MENKNREHFNFPIVAIGFMLTFFIMNYCHSAGLLKPVNGSDSDLKIKSHKVNVTLINGFAKTEVDQVFVNKTTKNLDAKYSFPIPKNASLSELSLWIDGNETIGEVLEKESAKKIHNNQKSNGNDSAIAEKNNFKTFEVEVSPVRANNETRVHLVYYQPIEIDLNIGRYVYPIAEGGVDDEQITFWNIDDEVSENFEFNLTLKSAFPVKDIRIPAFTNDAIINKLNNKKEEMSETYTVSIKYNESSSRLSKDIILYYRLEDTVPARVEIIPYKENESSYGTFMTVITPGASLKNITEGSDWVFILDKSGSMTGQKITKLTEGVSKVIGKMSSNDRFKILTFAERTEDFTNGFISATPENCAIWISNIKNISAGGGTALYNALLKGYNNIDSERTTAIILVTDGVTNIGDVATKSFLNVIKTHDIRLFTFIMGNSANEPLLEKMANISGGFAMNISNDDDIVGRLIQAKAKVIHECMQNVQIKIDGKYLSDNNTSIPKNIFLGQQIVFFGKYEKSSEIEIEMLAIINGKEETFSCKAILPEVDIDNPEIERIAALSKINTIMDIINEDGETTELIKKVIDLGIKYSLVTDYTSMLVIKESEMENLGIQRNNASRVNNERNALQNRINAPIKNYRVDNTNKNNEKGMFNGVSSPSIGSGPIGPIFLFIIWLLCKIKNEE